MGALRVVIFTGVSGGGKTTALRAVEDLGFYCVDNLPLPLVNGLMDLVLQEQGIRRVGLVVDARLPQYIAGYAQTAQELAQSGHVAEIVYLDAHDDVLVRRFSQTRRRHPLSDRDVPAGLTAERTLLAPLRAAATIHLDTSDFTPHELRDVIRGRYAEPGPQLVATLLSFGFRYGVPPQADLVLDARFIRNPYFVEGLRELTGRDAEVRRFVIEAPHAQEFVDRIEELLRFLIPRFEAEGKVYLTVAIGCTGGHHRSVALVEELAARLRAGHTVAVRHRDVER